MIIDKQSTSLKGQLILAQGKRSVALGWNMGVKIVRVITFRKGLSMFRTKRHESQFRPKEFFALIIISARTVFALLLLPKALPWARIN